MGRCYSMCRPGRDSHRGPVQQLPGTGKRVPGSSYWRGLRGRCGIPHTHVYVPFAPAQYGGGARPRRHSVNPVKCRANSNNPCGEFAMRKP